MCTTLRHSEGLSFRIASGYVWPGQENATYHCFPFYVLYQIINLTHVINLPPLHLHTSHLVEIKTKLVSALFNQWDAHFFICNLWEHVTASCCCVNMSASFSVNVPVSKWKTGGALWVEGKQPVAKTSSQLSRCVTELIKCAPIEPADRAELEKSLSDANKVSLISQLYGCILKSSQRLSGCDTSTGLFFNLTETDWKDVRQHLFLYYFAFRGIHKV